MTARSITGLFAAATFAAFVPCASASDAPPQPAPEMSNLKFFDGSWTCEGTMPPGPMGPGGKMTTSVKSYTDLGGFWQSGTVKSTITGTPPMEGMFHMTYDPGARQYVMLWVDNMGAWAKSTAAGWEGDKIAFSGEVAMGGKMMMTRETFLKDADGSFRRDAEAQMDGKWAPMGNETCKKVAGAAKK
jgi:hypothetical protein